MKPVKQDTGMNFEPIDGASPAEAAAFWRELHALVDEYRVQCLWFVKRDYYPRSREGALRMLEYVQKSGDLRGFKQAGELKQWLSQHSSVASAE